MEFSDNPVPGHKPVALAAERVPLSTDMGPESVDWPLDGLTEELVRLGMESHAAFLARAGLALASSLDADAIGQAIVRLAAGELGELCILHRLTDDGLRRVAVAHVDGSVQAGLDTLLERTEFGAAIPESIALRTQQAQIGTVNAGGSTPWCDRREEERLLRALSIRSYLVMPLPARDRMLGAISFLSSEVQPYDAQRFGTAHEFARRAAVALEHATLYENALYARVAADAARTASERLLAQWRASEDRYRNLFEQSRDAIYITAPDGTFLDANPAMLALLGYQRADLLRLNARDTYAEPNKRAELLRALTAEGSVRDYELMIRRSNGELIDCLVSATVRHDRHGEIMGYQGMVRDITERRRTELRVVESEHFVRAIIGSVRQGIIVFDREFRYQLWNRYMEEITGIRSEDVLGAHAPSVPYLHEHALAEFLQRALAGETVQADDTRFNIATTGKMGWISTAFSPHLSATGAVLGVVAIVHDITERKHAEQQLAHHAFHDALTRLPNRALFSDRLERMLNYSKRHPEHVFGVALLDLDRFKVITDSLGHVVGDELLVAIAQRLQHCIRHGDTVARLGGDEFAVLIDDIADVSDATRVAERVLREMSRPFKLPGHEVFTTGSIGIALSSTGYDRPEDILRDADTAMYRAKVDGRSRYEIFDRHMHQQAVRTLQVETDLRHALERNEFRVHYQPIIDLAVGNIVGFEALIRWQHPLRGLVSPGEFVPLAEETGLIVPIGWWVLRESCMQMQRWLERFPDRQDLTVSVNLSTRQFMQPDLIEQVDRALTLSGLPPHALKLEITESVVMQREELVTTMLNALRARGIRVCIDDFGTGYSSLRYLHTFPVDTLKIDRSFISSIGGGGHQPRLVDAIVALSKNMGMESVAEGVETQEQLAYLRTIGPQFAQGFLFSSARAPEEMEIMLMANPVW